MRAPFRPALAAAVIAAAVATGVGASAQDQLAISANPSLTPAFDPGIQDYVSRCADQGGIDFSVAAPAGTTVSVDGQPARAGNFDAHVRLGGGQGTTITARTGSVTRSYHVRCLPAGFPTWNFTRWRTPQARWYVVGPINRWAMIMSPNGAPVWWKRTHDKPFNVTLLPGNQIAWYPLGDDKFGTVADKSYLVHRLDGRVVRRLRTAGTPTDLHEFQELPNGHYLLDAYRPRKGVDLRKYGGPRSGKVFFAEIQELSHHGRMLWRWNARGHISLAETGSRWHSLVVTQKHFPARGRWYDAMHINSISPDRHGGLVISCRHTDAIYRIDRHTGRVDWKLGGTHTSHSLKVIGSPYSGQRTFGGQHDARVLPDGTVSVYDNGSERNRPPRVMRFRIDAHKRTATLIQSFSYPAVPKSGWGGGTRMLPGGDWATSWGGTNYVTETTATGAPVVEFKFTDASNYRVQPLPPGRLAPEKLRAAMDRMHPRG